MHLAIILPVTASLGHNCCSSVPGVVIVTVARIKKEGSDSEVADHNRPIARFLSMSATIQQQQQQQQVCCPSIMDRKEEAAVARMDVGGRIGREIFTRESYPISPQPVVVISLN